MQSQTSPRAVRIPLADVTLDGDLTVPDDAAGLVAFAHGSGSSRHSPRNRQGAGALQQRGYATLLMDLLTGQEEEVDLRTREVRFDIGLLAARLTGAVDWLGAEDDLKSLPVATFGASTGAPAALICAADRPEQVRVVVCRGGRVDLAGQALSRVRAPVRLIVGGDDRTVLELNEQAAVQLTGEVSVEVVPGATHLFEEAGALETVIDLTAEALDRWVTR